jgi:uncharacterized metal-binding protein
LPALGVPAFYLTRHGTLVLVLCGFFLFSGLMFGPDLDIYSRQYQRWGWLRWIWLPYRKSMSHRSILSHGILIGTLLRVAYLITLGLWVMLTGQVLWAVVQQGLGQAEDWRPLLGQWLNQGLRSLIWSLQAHADLWWAGFVGLELGSLSHSISDWMGSTIKRYLRRQVSRQRRQRR